MGASSLSPDGTRLWTKHFSGASPRSQTSKGLLVESSTNIVSLPVSRELLANMSFSSKAITPNDDGVNDELTLEVALVNVLASRPLRLYDLAGRPVYDLIHTVSYAT